MTRSLALSLLLSLAACAADEQASRSSPTVPRSDRADAPRPLGEAGAARVDLRPVGRGGASGTARLTRFDAGVRVELRAEDLSEGLHGVAVHDATDCAEVASSGHFDPEGAPHGNPEDPRALHHAGDLGNVRATGDGARMDRVFTALHLDGPTSAVGRVLVVHAEQDDLNTQPDGGAGAPVACGVIQPAE